MRDTAENVRLIGELIQSIDKDRAEVVMDVDIYEVSQTDLLQFGNQIGQRATSILAGRPASRPHRLRCRGQQSQQPGVNLGSIVGPRRTDRAGGSAGHSVIGASLLFSEGTTRN